MTSIITFDPPLGAVEHIYGGPSTSLSHSYPQLLHSPPKPSATILFTAQLSASHYSELLTRDGARLQIWTNIPTLEDDDAGGDTWREIEFTDPTTELLGLSAYTKVSLQVSEQQRKSAGPIRADDTCTLYIAVAIPLASQREYSFTYRIVYPSGRTTWLGFYECNGTLVVDANGKMDAVPSSRTIRYVESLSFNENWMPDSSLLNLAVYATGAENVESVEIAKVNNMTSMHIWALGKDSFLRYSSALILVPAPTTDKFREKPIHRPSYIFSASPGTNLSITLDGSITVSGSGTVEVRWVNWAQTIDPSAMVDAALSHSDLLSNWRIVASDTYTQSVVLACIGGGLPITGVIVSFGSLDSAITHRRTSVVTETSKLAAALDADTKGDDVEEFAIFSSSKEAMYVFSVDRKSEKSGKFLLEVDSSNMKFTEAHTFTLAPIYRLRTQAAAADLTRNWGAAILTSYKPVALSKQDKAKSPTTLDSFSDTITDARGLLTPPPSPPPFTEPALLLEGLKAIKPPMTSTSSGNISGPNEITAEKSVLRQRSIASRTDAQLAPANNPLPQLQTQLLDIASVVRATFRRAPSSSRSYPVEKTAYRTSKRPVPKAKQPSCLMWIFRLVFKCIFASVRIFVRVAFNIRLAIVWGVGVVARGPGFAWSLLWGIGSRPGWLPTVQSDRANQLGQINANSARRQSSSRPLSSGTIPGLRRQDDRETNICAINIGQTVETGAHTDRITVNMPRNLISWDTDQRLKRHASNPIEQRSIGSHLQGTAGVLDQWPDSQKDVNLPVDVDVQLNPNIGCSNLLDSVSNPITSCSRKPALRPQSESDDRKDDQKNDEAVFYATITPLCDTSIRPETVEIALLSLAPKYASGSEIDEHAYDGTTINASDYNPALLKSAVSFEANHGAHDDSSADLNITTPVPVITSTVERITSEIILTTEPTRLPPLGTSTASCSSILDSGADRGLTTLGKQNVGQLHQMNNTQYGGFGYVLRYQLPANTNEAGPTVVAVRAPEPESMGQDIFCAKPE